MLYLTNDNITDIKDYILLMKDFQSSIESSQIILAGLDFSKKNDHIGRMKWETYYKLREIRLYLK